jgi:hypothetical protein
MKRATIPPVPLLVQPRPGSREIRLRPPADRSMQRPRTQEVRHV